MNFKEVIENTDYDFLRKNEHLGNNICLLGLGGSHAYGTNVEGSDIDIRGIATRTKEDILLGRDFENVIETNTDTTVYSLDKMLGLLAECNPNCIEIVSLRPDQYLYLNRVGQKILDNKHLFLSKRCINTFGGYANQQLYRLQQKTLMALSTEEYNAHISKVLDSMCKHLEDRYGLIATSHIDEEGDIRVAFKSIDTKLTNVSGILSELNNTYRAYTKESKRNKQALEHNKINKHAMHLIRLYAMANDLLEFGEVLTYRDKEHDLLMDIRNGKYMGPDEKPTKKFFDILREYEARFNELKKTTKLPDEPDMKGIAKLRYEINEQIVRG